MQEFKKLTYQLKMQNIMIAYVLLAMVVLNAFKFMLMTMVLATFGIMKHYEVIARVQEFQKAGVASLLYKCILCIFVFLLDFKIVCNDVVNSDG